MELHVSHICANFLQLLGNVTSEDILRVLLKHLHQMMPFAACLPTISKSIVKQLIKLWSSNNDDTVKVISFLCILRYVTSDVSMYLHTILKVSIFLLLIFSFYGLFLEYHYRFSMFDLKEKSYSHSFIL